MHRLSFAWPALSVLLLAGCGTATRLDFKGQTRAAPPAAVSVYVNDRHVLVSPSSVNAGLITFNVTNEASHPEALWLAGTGGNCTLGTSGPVTPGQTAQFTVQLLIGAYTIGPCALKGAPGATPIKLGSLVVNAPSQAGNSALLQP